MHFAMTLVAFSVEPQWVFYDLKIPGGQAEGAMGPNGNIHIMAKHYHKISPQGELLFSHKSVWDRGQLGLSFTPAITVDKNGNAHTIGRMQGQFSNNDLMYHRIKPDGSMNKFLIGKKEERNYVVSIASDGNGNLFGLWSSTGSGRSINIEKIEETQSTKIASLIGHWRPDNDARIRARNGILYLVIGKNDPGGKAVFSWANPKQSSLSIQKQFTNNLQTHKTAGAGRRGFPDVAIDTHGNAHFVYGSKPGLVFYNKYSSSHNKVYAEDKQIISDLGTWHLSCGISAITVSDNGQYVLAIGLKSDGSPHASNSEIMYTYSKDKGETWSPVKGLNIFTNAGEGRRRPRLMARGNKFYMTYFSKKNGGIDMASLDFSDPANVNHAHFFKPLTPMGNENLFLGNINLRVTQERSIHGRFILSN